MSMEESCDSWLAEEAERKLDLLDKIPKAGVDQLLPLVRFPHLTRGTLQVWWEWVMAAGTGMDVVGGVSFSHS